MQQPVTGHAEASRRIKEIVDRALVELEREKREREEAEAEMRECRRIRGAEQ